MADRNFCRKTRFCADKKIEKQDKNRWQEAYQSVFISLPDEIN